MAVTLPWGLTRMAASVNRAWRRRPGHACIIRGVERWGAVSRPNRSCHPTTIYSRRCRARLQPDLKYQVGTVRALPTDSSPNFQQWRCNQTGHSGRQSHYYAFPGPAAALTGCVPGWLAEAAGPITYEEHKWRPSRDAVILLSTSASIRDHRRQRTTKAGLAGPAGGDQRKP